eukprot:3618292-Rhodomonas_salina.1
MKNILRGTQYHPAWHPTHLLCHVRYWPRVLLLRCYARATPCPVLTKDSMPLPGKGYAEMDEEHPVCSAICLRACYAMSGTDLAYGAICLRSCYAMSGTDLGYAATRRRSGIS